jgi:hypothetical protein
MPCELILLLASFSRKLLNPAKSGAGPSIKAFVPYIYAQIAQLRHRNGQKANIIGS